MKYCLKNGLLVIRLIGVLLLCVSISNCSSTIQPSESKTLPDDTMSTAQVGQPQLAGITAFSYFSAYMSDSAVSKCEAEYVQCFEDSIKSVDWFNTLQQVLRPAKVTDAGTESDYEVLIASHIRQTPTDSLLQRTLGGFFSGDKLDSGLTVHGEITLQWRGFALDTYTVSSAVNASSLTKDQARNTTQTLLARWLTHATNTGIFTREFLYTALKASNYRDELVLPITLDEFYLEDIQLYPDPFLGVIARYRHPVFLDALIDINISPIMAPYSDTNIEALNTTLENELAQARLIATSRQLALISDAPITRLEAGQNSGLFFAVHAVDEFKEPLYASTYVFQQQDKIIKFTSTFPHTVTTPLVEKAIAQIIVPAESALMRELRAMF